MQSNAFFQPMFRRIINIFLTLLGLVLFIYVGGKALGQIGNKKVVYGRPNKPTVLPSPAVGLADLPSSHVLAQSNAETTNPDTQTDIPRQQVTHQTQTHTDHQITYVRTMSASYSENWSSSSSNSLANSSQNSAVNNQHD